MKRELQKEELWDSLTTLLHFCVDNCRTRTSKAYIITQFGKEYQTELDNTEVQYQHYDERIFSQERFHHQDNTLLDVFTELGNHVRRTAMDCS